MKKGLASPLQNYRLLGPRKRRKKGKGGQRKKRGRKEEGPRKEKRKKENKRNRPPVHRQKNLKIT